MGEKLFDGACDGVMSLGVVALEPLSEILVTFIAEAWYHARPIKASAAIVAALGVRQIELGIDGAVGNSGFRRVGRSHSKRNGAQEEECCSHRITLSQPP